MQAPGRSCREKAEPRPCHNLDVVPAQRSPTGSLAGTTSFGLVRDKDNKNVPLLPYRLVGVPTLALEFPGKRLDRAVVLLGLAAFLVPAGFFRKVEFWSRAFVGGGDDGARHPQHQAVGGSGFVGRYQCRDFDILG